MPEVLISADENNEQVMMWLDHYGISYQRSKYSFEVGDYIVGGYEDDDGYYGKIVVEHKTMIDFVNSLFSERMNNQEVDLSFNFRLSILCVVGMVEMELSTAKMQFSPDTTSEQYDKALTSILAGKVSAMWKRSNQGEEGNISYINFDTERAFVLFLRELNKWVDKEDARIPKMERLSRRSEWQMQFFLQSIPDVGELIAKNLMFNFDNPYDLITASIGELRAVEGIGPKTADKIFNFFRSNWKKIF